MTEQPSAWEDPTSFCFCIGAVALTMMLFPLTYKIFERGMDPAISISIYVLFGTIMLTNFFIEYRKFGEVTPLGVGISFIVFGLLSEPVNRLFGS